MERDWPDLAILDLLVAISEQGSLSAAARSAGMAQPNASRAISRWERTLRLRLIERHPHGSTLTPQGQAIAEWAQPVLASAREFSDSLTSLSPAAPERSLLIAASMTIAENLVPRWLGALHQEHPETEMTLSVRNSEDVYDLVESGDVSLGFVETPQTRVGLHTRVIGVDRLLVVVAPNHPLAHRDEPLTAAELADTPLIVRERGSGTRLTLDRAFGDVATCAPALELGSNSAVRASVLGGLHPAVLSELAVASWVRDGSLCAVPLVDMDLHRQLRAVWRGGPTLTGTARLLVDLVASDPRINGPQAD